MILLKKISMTMAVIIFTALSIYNFQRAVPIEDTAYSFYTNSYFSILLLSVGVLIILLVSNYRNRIMNSCLFFIGLVFALGGIKGYFKVLDSHRGYDIAFIGAFAIMSISYLLAPYYKKMLSLFKTIINQVYMRCQTNKKLD